MRANPRFHYHLHCVHTRSIVAHMCPRAFFNSLSLLCLIWCVFKCVCIGLNFFQEPWQAQTARPDAKDQADGHYEDGWNWGCYSCAHSFTESWAGAALSETVMYCIASDLVTDQSEGTRTLQWHLGVSHSEAWHINKSHTDSKVAHLLFVCRLLVNSLLTQNQTK